MKPRVADWLRWLLPLLAGIALTLALALLKITDVYYAILAGLALELIAVLHSISSHLRSIETKLGQIRSVPKIPRILDNIQEIASRRSRFQSLLLTREADIFDATMDQLSRGRQIVSPTHFMELAEGIYAELRQHERLRATSVFGGGEYWRQRYGQQYANLNKMAGERGVEIERTYILSDDRQLREKLPIMQAQLGYSNVRFLLLTEAMIDDKDLRDFFVIDKELAAEFHFQGEVITHIDVVCNRDEVAELEKTMNKIVSAARPLEDATAILQGKPR